MYELCWDVSEEHCIHDPKAFRGFCYPAAVVEEERENTGRGGTCRRGRVNPRASPNPGRPSFETLFGSRRRRYFSDRPPGEFGSGVGHPRQPKLAFKSASRSK